MSTAGLSADPKEYRERLADQSDDQIDAWAAELMRDVAIRRGVVKVVADFRRAAVSILAKLYCSICFRLFVTASWNSSPGPRRTCRQTFARPWG